jgi:hypothetical protein
VGLIQRKQNNNILLGWNRLAEKSKIAQYGVPLIQAAKQFGTAMQSSCPCVVSKWELFNADIKPSCRGHSS